MSSIISSTSGKFKADKIQYPDGIGCCIWVPYPDLPECGMCFDFSASDIPELITMLQELQTIEPEEFKEEI